MVDHVAVRRGVWAPGRAALGLDLQPRLTQGLGEMVVHRARNGHGVCYRFWLLVVLPKTATKMLLDNRVAGRVRVRGSPVVCSQVGRAAVVRYGAVGEVTVSIVSWSTCDHRGTILLALNRADSRGDGDSAVNVHVFGQCERLVHGQAGHVGVKRTTNKTHGGAGDALDGTAAAIPGVLAVVPVGRLG